jgi:Zn-dependent peptidase ImmA (M78 family)/transcriptional regulator with XRE-family HTH domain
MIQLVRLARGLTQTELARLCGLSQAVLSKVESGVLDLDATRLTAVATALNVPLPRLTASKPVNGVLSACAFHRKRSSLPVSDAKRIRATLDLRRMQVESLIPAGDATITLLRKPPSDDEWDDNPETIAAEVRKSMGLGDGPIPDLVSAVEAAGAVVMVTDLDAARIDAIGNWPEGHRPIFMMNSAAPADRRRFSLAHEVGHAVMHQVPKPDQEVEADRFASELLMPTNTVRGELANVNLASLVDLKTRWGVSMSALIRKARDVNAISDYDYKRLNIALSTAGYRTREPVELPTEVPALISRTLRRRLQREPIPALAEEALMTTDEFTTIYLEGSSEH